MIAQIKEYILNIAIYIIICGFINVILPIGSFKKYVGLIVGVVFVILVLEPLKRG